MKKQLTIFMYISLILSLLLFVSAAFAAGPYLVCDPAVNVSKYQVRLSLDNATWGTWVESPAQTDGSMKYDVSAVTPANYYGQAQAYGTYTVTDSTTGAVSTVEGWSVSAPFLLKTPGSSKNIKITR